MKFIKKIFPFAFFLILSLGFFHKSLSGLVPLPLDALTGAYFPWLNQKWGYPVGVPVKNIAISDSFSQHFPWRVEAIRQIKEGIVPLWNPYQFSGYPLLANWQSTPLYPLNLFMLIFGDLTGWTLISILQPIIAGLCTYLFLRSLKLSKVASMFGGLVYAYSAFGIIFLTYSTFSHAAAWLPLIFLATNLLLSHKKFIGFPILIFSILILVLAGNFQVLLYSLIFSYIFSIYLALKQKANKKLLFYVHLGYILGILISAFYLFPIFELFRFSFRTTDANIAEYFYGLIPLKSLITLLAPDYYGNPATNNFRGFLYHETSFYFGVTPLILTIAGIFFSPKFPHKKLFSIFFVFSLLFVLRTPIGKLVYDLHLPLISTSYASRINVILNFTGVILSAINIHLFLKNKNLPKIPAILVFATIIGLTFLTYRLVSISPDFNISFRNTLLPLAISMVVLILVFVKNKYLVLVVLFALTIFDLFRFGLKYNPFTPRHLNYPETPSLSFLKENIGFYRFDKEKGEILPSNTWVPFRLQNPGGYDPLYPNNYAKFYNVLNGGPPTASPSRYAEFFKYDSPFLDLVGVKYLLALKRNQFGIPDEKGNIIQDLYQPRFREVFQEGPLVVLENLNVMPRAQVYFDFKIYADPLLVMSLEGNNSNFKNQLYLSSQPNVNPIPSSPVSAEIISYQADRVQIMSNVDKPGILLLTDTNYPGWKVKVNGQHSKLMNLFGIFKGVEVPSGESMVEFYYRPFSFYMGVAISLLALIATILFIKLGSVKKI